MTRDSLHGHFCLGQKCPQMAPSIEGGAPNKTRTQLRSGPTVAIVGALRVAFCTQNDLNKHQLPANQADNWSCGVVPAQYRYSKAHGFYARLVIPIKRTPQVVQAPCESEIYRPPYAASCPADNNLTFETACWRHSGLEAPVSHMTQVHTQLWFERQRQRRPVALLAPLRGQETHCATRVLEGD